MNRCRNICGSGWALTTSLKLSRQVKFSHNIRFAADLKKISKTIPLSPYFLTYLSSDSGLKSMEFCAAIDSSKSAYLFETGCLFTKFAVSSIA